MSPVRRRGDRKLILLLGALTTVEVLAVDMYLPALPAISVGLGITPTQAQQTLSILLVGLCLGQAAWGAISDTWGRRSPMLWGLAMFIVGSAISAFANDLRFMCIGRFLQGLGAASGFVVARAMVSDCWSEEQSAPVFSLIMQMIGLAAMIAPALGVALLLYFQWPAIFVCFVVLGCLCLLWSWFDLPETLMREKAQPSHGSVASVALSMLRSRRFILPTTAVSASLALMLGLIGGGAFVFITAFEWTVMQYAGVCAATSLMFVALSSANRIVLRRATPSAVLRGGCVLQLILAVLATGSAFLQPTQEILFACLFASLVGVTAFTIGNGTALAMSAVSPRHGGVASAILGVMQYGAGALATAVGAWHTSAAVSVSTVSLICAVLAIGAERSAVSVEPIRV